MPLPLHPYILNSEKDTERVILISTKSQQEDVLADHYSHLACSGIWDPQSKIGAHDQEREQSSVCRLWAKWPWSDGFSPVRIDRLLRSL